MQRYSARIFDGVFVKMAFISRCEHSIRYPLVASIGFRSFLHASHLGEDRWVRQGGADEGNRVGL